ncbi:hypothetical protein [Synechococcus sp. CS-1328]|uniref:hypothetical protein n=1 Tax=Synechococcus sp. CS-1328 TaxID=2847976 RepID=UPI00223BACB5|nr:hypothetical protein [Synechococcus sp. CS-1328]MCT0225837.1 hypothetical protein [Synechococcus sp. CS-1328]
MKRNSDGDTVIEASQATMVPERARLLWQELADYAQQRALSEEARRQALEDALSPGGPLPVVLPPELLTLPRSRRCGA